MQDVAFYFDPLCPWAWRTSLWIREVRKEQRLNITWKLFSLQEVHRSSDPLAQGPAEVDLSLRLLLLARARGGNEAIDRLYLALGHARHDAQADLGSEEVLRAALQEADLSPDLLQQAQQDAAIGDAVLAEHREAVERHGAFGVPWLVPAEQEFGFYGPIISEVPSGAEAVALWQHSSYMLQQPYLYELKRSRG